MENLTRHRKNIFISFNKWSEEKVKKFYNIEGMIRNGFKLSRDYETLDFSFANFSDAAAESLSKHKGEINDEDPKEWAEEFKANQ